MPQFTSSKQRVRELNLEIIKSHFDVPSRYLGLTSPQMDDIELFYPCLSCVHAVERGMPGQEWKTQHDLAVTAILRGFPRFKLFRGEVDQIVLSGKDVNGQVLEWPYEIVNLDYTGGIIYKEEPTSRIKAIQKVIEEQGDRASSFILLITVNDRHHDQGEIDRVLDDLRRECQGMIEDQSLLDIKRGEDRRLAVFLYTSFVVITTARQWFRVETFKPILYTGTAGYRMLNLSFYMGAVSDREAPTAATRALCKLVATEPITLDV